MGASTSDLGQKEVDELVRETNFTPAEIHRLYRRFQRLDKDGSSTLSTDEFLSIPELAMNPLAMCVIARFDRNKTDAVTFKQFCQTLSVFSVKEDKQNKLRFAFDVYDDKGDGYIDREELGLILRLMVRYDLLCALVILDVLFAFQRCANGIFGIASVVIPQMRSMLVDGIHTGEAKHYSYCGRLLWM
eukprot:TRINITY_DN1120_c0_g1_i2.p1 TRINITY_DN1120_c0_g1~~TRINITY_DN1120_c0_g1_i2.p1  ORF type:complete len:188 (-),score=41.08 TRINITY_DN1120_c0_g1_i2:639-1202(-)